MTKNHKEMRLIMKSYVIKNSRTGNPTFWILASKSYDLIHNDNSLTLALQIVSNPFVAKLCCNVTYRKLLLMAVFTDHGRNIWCGLKNYYMHGEVYERRSRHCQSHFNNASFNANVLNIDRSMRKQQFQMAGCILLTWLDLLTWLPYIILTLMKG